ncbi:hypothetical protein J1N10_09155 [Carboxylicivirga sp. A043]|uniref:hypothetical protein n=1 Tax=Carboxylicivirga litoralis TaxID=2816963 RepID=UPI0021CB7417|nr:hypothetical protein [Carboxylicivirga sp. A043]MCU4156146.1 hypothetical protein [Carboxylicivirga sp. A043]
MNYPIANNKHRSAGVFKRWSRKGYAIFGSLGFVVHIGRLSVVLLQCIGQLILHIETELQLALKSLEEEEGNEQELVELELITLVSNADVVIGAYKKRR